MKKLLKQYMTLTVNCLCSFQFLTLPFVESDTEEEGKHNQDISDDEER